jgi:threonine/homoserine/homoserine lactone efflux protein
MAIEAWLAFVGASVVILVIPGPTILTVISYSLAHGRRAQLPLVAAVALGDSTVAVGSLVGLGNLLAASPFWSNAVRWVGGLYLLYLGIRKLSERVRAPSFTERAAPESSWTLFANTYAVTALHPKGIVFYVMFVPQFMNTRAEVAPQLAIMGVTFVILAIANATLYAVFASRARALFASTAALRDFNVLGGMLLSGAGIWTLIS